MFKDYDSAKELLTKAQKMSIAEKVRSLEDQLVMYRNNEKALCMNMFKPNR